MQNSLNFNSRLQTLINVNASIKLVGSLIKTIKTYPNNPNKFTMIAWEKNVTNSSIFSGIYLQQKKHWDQNGVLDDLTFENIDELFVNPKKSKAFQLLMYVYLYVKKNPKSINSKINAGIFSFKNLKSGLLYLSVKEKNKIKKLTITDEIINTFEENLKSLVLRILNDDFVETEDKKSYEWIDYSSIYRV